MPNNAKLALIHVAKNELRLGEDEYRLILHSVCKVESAKDIKKDKDVKALMDAFRRLGFKQTQAIKKIKRPNEKAPAFHLITDGQIHLIETLWLRVTKFPDTWRETLNNFLQKRFKSQSLNTMNRNLAGKVIETLKEMSMRALLNRCHQVFHGKENEQEIVETHLIDLYMKTKLEFTHDELAIIITALMYNNGGFGGKVYQCRELIQINLDQEPKPKE